MLVLKKLIFAPFFLIIFLTLIYKLTPFLTNYDFVFSLSINTLFDLITLSVLICFSCFIFALFITLSSDFKFSLPVIFIAALVPFLFLDPALAIVFGVTIFIALLLINLSLDSSLRNYLTFQPSTLLGPAIRNLSTLIILSFCLIYFFSVNKIVAQKGFTVPDSLLDTALKFSSPASTSLNTPTSQLNLPPEQLALLKQNPDLLQQFGLNPKMLDSLDLQKITQTPEQLSTDLIKQAVKDQVDGFLKPYLSFIPIILALLLFLTFQSLVSIINIFIYPLLYILFFILEKTKFIRFEIEQRPVRKLVV